MDLLALLDQSESELRSKFTCPRLAVELEARLAPAHEVAAARAASSREWGDREVKTAMDENALALVALQHQAAVSIYADGAPVGIDVARRVDATTLRAWMAHVEQLEARISPPLETWSQEQVDSFVAGLKKKDAACVASLNLFDSSTLIGFALYMADRLARSETSISSTGSESTTG